jgi:hypothetical protein
LAIRPLLLEQAPLLSERLFGFGRLMVRSKGVDALHHCPVKHRAVLLDAPSQRCNSYGHVAFLKVGTEAMYACSPRPASDMCQAT